MKLFCLGMRTRSNFKKWFIIITKIRTAVVSRIERERVVITEEQTGF